MARHGQPAFRREQPYCTSFVGGVALLFADKFMDITPPIVRYYILVCGCRSRLIWKTINKNRPKANNNSIYLFSLVLLGIGWNYVRQPGRIISATIKNSSEPVMCALKTTLAWGVNDARTDNGRYVIRPHAPDAAQCDHNAIIMTSQRGLTLQGNEQISVVNEGKRCGVTEQKRLKLRHYCW